PRLECTRVLSRSRGRHPAQRVGRHRHDVRINVCNRDGVTADRRPHCEAAVPAAYVEPLRARANERFQSAPYKFNPQLVPGLPHHRGVIRRSTAQRPSYVTSLAETRPCEAPWVPFRVSARRIGVCPRSSVRSCVTVPCAWSTTAR